MKTKNAHKYSFHPERIDPEPELKLGRSIEGYVLIRAVIKTDTPGFYPFMRCRYHSNQALFIIKTHSFYACLQ